MTIFYCRVFFVRSSARGLLMLCNRVLYLGSNRIFKIFNTKWSYDKCLLTELSRAGRENIWLLVRMYGPRAKYFLVRPSHSVNEYMV